jgi:hypothetical protein
MNGKTNEKRGTMKKSGRNEINVGPNDRTVHILEVQKLHDWFYSSHIEQCEIEKGFEKEIELNGRK